MSLPAKVEEEKNTPSLGGTLAVVAVVGGVFGALALFKKPASSRASARQKRRAEFSERLAGSWMPEWMESAGEGADMPGEGIHGVDSFIATRKRAEEDKAEAERAAAARTEAAKVEQERAARIERAAKRAAKAEEAMPGEDVRLQYAPAEFGWAEYLGGGMYRLSNTPTEVEGLKFGDIVVPVGETLESVK